MAVSAIEQAALDSAENYSVYDFLTKDIPSNRAFHVFELPKIALEVVEKVAGIATATIHPFTLALGKIVDAENFVFFLQDLVDIPKSSTKLYNKVSGWMNGSVESMELANSVRKFGAKICSTVGDYSGAIDTLKKLEVYLDRIDVVTDKVGYVASILGASSKLYDYAFENVEQEGKNKLNPSLEAVRKPFEDSRAFWDASMQVAVIALSTLGLTVGIGTYPAIVTLLSGGLLGSRMISFYRTCQLNAMEASHPQMKTVKI